MSNRTYSQRNYIRRIDIYAWGGVSSVGIILSPVFITIGRIRFTPIIASLCPTPPIKVIRRKCAERFSALSKTPGGIMLRLGRRADKFGWPVEFNEFKSVLGVGKGVLFGETLK